MDTWGSRDLPALRAVVQLSDERRGGHVRAEEIAEHLGLDEDTTQRALWALAGEDPPFFEWTDSGTFGRGMNQVIGGVWKPTGHARRTVGAWPQAETIADRFVKALEQAAQNEPDPVQRGKLRQVADVVSDAGKGVVIGVLTNVITGQVS